MSTRVLAKTVEIIHLKVAVILRDIINACCGNWNKCMIRVAVERALREIDPKGGDHKVKVDVGIIRFNLWGHHWSVPLPAVAKKALVQFDGEEKARKRAAKLGEKFQSQVRPFKFTVEPVKGSKINPMPPGRQEQINAARRRRILAGRPDKPAYNLRKRVVGLGNV